MREQSLLAHIFFIVNLNAFSFDKLNDKLNKDKDIIKKITYEYDANANDNMLMW